MSFTENNHYVPQWHQRYFLSPGETELHYMNLDPFVTGTDGKRHEINAVGRKGPVGCFAEKNLYTLAFGAEKSDVIEKRFFGEVDARGAKALPLLAEFEFGKHGMDCVRDFAHYLNAQKMRTPKGLEWVKSISHDGTHSGALLSLPHLSQTHITIWSEGIWEIFCCDNTETKFILSDHPVATYNKGAFPDSAYSKYPLDAGIDLLGTRTIFPLTPTRCLVISNLGYVRDPGAAPLQQRINPRVMADTIMFAGNIHTGRQLREDQVVAINYILKKRARRYLAAGKEE